MNRILPDVTLIFVSNLSVPVIALVVYFEVTENSEPGCSDSNKNAAS